MWAKKKWLPAVSSGTPQCPSRPVSTWQYPARPSSPVVSGPAVTVPRLGGREWPSTSPAVSGTVVTGDPVWSLQGVCGSLCRGPVRGWQRPGIKGLLGPRIAEHPVPLPPGLAAPVPVRGALLMNLSYPCPVRSSQTQLLPTSALPGPFESTCRPERGSLSMAVPAPAFRCPRFLLNLQKSLSEINEYPPGLNAS